MNDTACDPGQRLRLSLCALDLVIRAGERAGRHADMSLTNDGRMVLHLPGGSLYEILGGEMDEMQARGWVEVFAEEGDEGSLALTERGSYWANRWRNDRKFLASWGVA